MLPIRDYQRPRRFPLVTILIIVANALVFVVELQTELAGGQRAMREFMLRYGVVPRALFQPELYGEGGLALALRSLITTQFVHGGFLHIALNMLFLWVFGDNVEDVLGGLRFLIFYLGCGVAGGLLHALMQPDSLTPAVGASGAISGVMGAYLVRFPQSRITTLMFFFFVFGFSELPAVVLIGYWFILQLLSGFASLGAPSQTGTAWFAHIGGFVCGYLLMRWQTRRRRPRPPRIWIE